MDLNDLKFDNITRENILMVDRMVWESFCGRMVSNMKGNGKKD